MATFHVLIFLNPADGQEDTFHEWYENTHLDDVLRTAGFRAAQRFGLELTVGAMESPNQHLAWYEAEGDSAEEIMARLNNTRDQRDMSGGSSIDASNAAFWVFSELGERHVFDG